MQWDLNGLGQKKAARSKLTWRYLVIDEANRIKNKQRILSKVVRMLSTHFRLLISGTPRQINLHEFWAALAVFFDSASFGDYFSLDGDLAPGDTLHQPRKILRPF